MRDIQEINMAGPKNKNKKTKEFHRIDKDGNRTYVYDSPSQTSTLKKYNESGKKSGEKDFSFIDKTGKSGGTFSGKSKTIDTKPNKQVRTTQFADTPKKKTVSTSSTQEGNYKSSYKTVPSKKSGAGYSGD